MICVLREVNGVWTELVLFEQDRYKEYTGCYSLLSVCRR